MERSAGLEMRGVIAAEEELNAPRHKQPSRHGVGRDCGISAIAISNIAKSLDLRTRPRGKVVTNTR